MKKIIQISLTLLTIISCTNKPTKKNEVFDSSELNTEVKTGSESQIDLIENKNFKIDFPLDSLLSFDSEKELKKLFGKNVKRSVGYYPEGMGEYSNTLLFPNSKNEVEFVWEDDSLSFSKLSYIRLSKKNTDWKTKEGITIGTGIKELESLNKKAFTFFGLGWDYSGSINWNDGNLDKRKIFGSLEYPNNTMPNEFESLLGEQEISSSSEIALKARLVLDELIMRPNK